MTRYFWPGETYFDADRLLLRHEHLMFADVFAPPDFMSLQFAARAAYMETLSEGDTDLWLPIGPATMIRGQATGEPPVAGRVRDLKISPDGRRAYAASANGGVWYSADAGQSWSPLGSWGIYSGASATGSEALSLTIGALDVHFGQNGDGTDNPDLDVVYAATGEGRPWLSATPGGKHGGWEFCASTAP